MEKDFDKFLNSFYKELFALNYFLNNAKYEMINHAQIFEQLLHAQQHIDTALNHIQDATKIL